MKNFLLLLILFSCNSVFAVSFQTLKTNSDLKKYNITLDQETNLNSTCQKVSISITDSYFDADLGTRYVTQLNLITNSEKHSGYLIVKNALLSIPIKYKKIENEIKSSFCISPENTQLTYVEVVYSREKSPPLVLFIPSSLFNTKKTETKK